MFGSNILDVAIGVIFVFALVSIICAAIREGIEAWLKTRAAYLERGIRELLHDPKAVGLARSFYEHPLIYSLYSGDYRPKPPSRSDPAQPGARRSDPPLLERGENLPSYIPSRNFALALMDIAARGPDGSANSGPTSPKISIAAIRANVMYIPNVRVRRAVLTAVDTANDDIDRARQSLEDWYDGAMDRVSGWYKRSTQQILFLIGLFVAVVMNVNVITVADYLNRDDAARAAFVAAAQRATKDTTPDYDAARRQVDSLSLPIGWSRGWGTPRQGVTLKNSGCRAWAECKSWLSDDLLRGEFLWNSVIGPIFGLLLTAFAATLGAPFWFDVLNKVMVIRSTVKPHEKSPEEASEDRQDPKKQETGKEIVVTKEEKPKEDATPPVTPAVVVPDRGDVESDVDSCQVIAAGAAAGITTTDENLPAASGGVA